MIYMFSLPEWKQIPRRSVFLNCYDLFTSWIYANVKINTFIENFICLGNDAAASVGNHFPTF